MMISSEQKRGSYRTCALIFPLTALLLAGCASAPSADPAPVAQSRASAAQDNHLLRPVLAGTTADLRQELESALRNVYDKRIDTLPAGLRVSLPTNAGFTTGKANILPELAVTLQRLVPVLDRYRNVRLHIVAHTDAVGSEMSNLRLTIQRADAVMEYLRNQGVALTRMSADGHGEAEPIADNNKPEGRARNRRVEIFLTSS